MTKEYKAALEIQCPECNAPPGEICSYAIVRPGMGHRDEKKAVLHIKRFIMSNDQNRNEPGRRRDYIAEGTAIHSAWAELHRLDKSRAAKTRSKIGKVYLRTCVRVGQFLRRVGAAFIHHGVRHW